MLAAGVGLMGASLRTACRYRLVELRADGGRVVEEFRAADDASAVHQALAAAEGQAMEVWRGARLIHRGDRRSLAA